MNELVRAFVALQLRDRLLLALIVASVALALVSVAFAIAALVLRSRNVRKARRWTQLEAHWETGLLELITGDITPDQLRSRVEREDASYFIDYLTRFAQRMRGAERKLVEEVAAPYLQLIVGQLRSRRPGTRARAVRTLSLLGLRAHAPQIISALDDRSPVVAMTAARELCRRENPEFAPAVLLRLDRFRTWSPAYLSAMLAGIGPDAATFLRGTLASEYEPALVRAVAADALRALHDIDAVAVAARLLTRVKQRDLVAAALRLVRQGGNARHAAVVRSFANDPDELIRAQALAALSTLGGPQDLPLLTAALADPSVWVASHAARALVGNAGRSVLEAVAGSDHPRAGLARQTLVEAG